MILSFFNYLINQTKYVYTRLHCMPGIHFIACYHATASGLSTCTKVSFHKISKIVDLYSIVLMI